MIYLAIPYTGIEETSFSIATLITGQLMKRGHPVFSPITHSHEVAKRTQLPTSWDYWEKVDHAFLDKCDELLVVAIDGHHQSVGVQAEQEYMRKSGKPVSFMWLDEEMSELHNALFFVSHDKRFADLMIYN